MTDDMYSRVPSTMEVALVRRLLSVDFPGSATLRTMAEHFSVKTLDKNGSLQINPSSNERAEVVKQIPVEGEVEDADGIKVHVLLHVTDGILNELEIYKEDGSTLSAFNILEDIDVFVLPPHPNH